MYEFPCVLCITVNGKEGCQANIDKWHNLLQNRASADECLGDQNNGLTRSRISFSFCYLDKFFLLLTYALQMQNTALKNNHFHWGSVFSIHNSLDPNFSFH